ncbi:hypothetical protein CDD82_2374 [Ophiocordyceps australis]|uniref:Uncharacterized protein n=1 Tax=Ophiocordyceps australis TaxID=1399860 RepID=A0A2C5ZC45_9HYPO|nr:hypothetical protein CDD82_2374 [Ophiocordyceps australis]
MNDCPEEERFIIESRWNHRYKRGLDMWSSIQHDFSIRFNKSPEIDSLQTKFQRARSRYIKWLPEDEEILREACNTMERRKYQHLLEMFYDMGGSKNMRLNAEDIKDKVEKDIKEDELLCEEIDEVVRKAEAERLNMERDNPEEPMDVNLDRATNYDKDKGTAKIYQGTA